MDFIADNYAPIEEDEGLERLGKKGDFLLEGEKLLYSFRGRGGSGRDYLFFTNLRIIDLDKKGVSGKRKKYTSLSYGYIKAYEIETAGSLDTNTELKIFSSISYKWNFAKDKFNIFKLSHLLDSKVLNNKNTGSDVAGGAPETMDIKTGSGSVLAWMSGDSHQMNAAEVEAQFKSQSSILLDDETVEMAFKCGRDSLLLTSKRFLKIDVQGLTGKRIAYTTILWSNICALEVETPGSSYFDRDADCVIYTSVRGYNRIELDLRKGRGDYYALQQYISNKILGDDTVALSENAPNTEGLKDKKPGFIGWLDGDYRTIDASVVNDMFHNEVPILQHCETVEMAFKGRRDMLCLTTKRLLVINKKGIIDRKTNYVSVPWTTILCFGVSTKGGGFDNDVELFIHTKIYDIYYPPADGDNPPPPPEPRMSCLEFDLVAKSVDILAIKRYMSDRILSSKGDVSNLSETLSSDYILSQSPPNGISRFMDWIGDNARAVDPQEANRFLHEDNPVLQKEEFVVMAFSCGRDMFFLTSDRVMHMDRRGFTGKKTSWISIPYSSICSYSVESAGRFDRDSELKLYGNWYWYDDQPMSHIKQDFRKGSVNIIAIENLLSAKLLKQDSGEALVDSRTSGESEGGFDSIVSFLKEAAIEVNTDDIDEQFRNKIPILQDDEVVELGYRSGRDMAIYTSKRFIIFDRQGWSGKKIEILSMPIHYFQGFSVSSAGSFMSEAHAELISKVSGMSSHNQDLHKKADIYALQMFLAKKILL